MICLQSTGLVDWTCELEVDCTKYLFMLSSENSPVYGSDCSIKLDDLKHAHPILYVYSASLEASIYHRQ